MVIDEAQIAALKSGEATAVAEPPVARGPVPQEFPVPTNQVQPPESCIATKAPNSARPKAAPPTGKLAQILRLKVPVIVELAQRQANIGYVRRLSLGTIIEFSKPVDEALTLRINNRNIGRGEAVKVGERLGLRVSAIQDAAERVRSLGK